MDIYSQHLAAALEHQRNAAETALAHATAQNTVLAEQLMAAQRQLKELTSTPAAVGAVHEPAPETGESQTKH